MFYRARPPLNKQNWENSCWAACIDSFSRISSHIPTQREKALAHKFGDATNAYGLTVPKLAALDAYLKPYGSKLWSSNVGVIAIQEIENRLLNSHVMLMSGVDSTDMHAVLIYGVDNAHVSFMDPRKGEYRTKSVTYFDNTLGLAMLWRQ